MNLIIYFVAFLEWFTTLSVEIVALRNFTPIIWSNSISTSVVLGIILLALSYGYYIGGKISVKKENLKEKLVKNLVFASLYYFFISFPFSPFLLENLLTISGSYFFSILISSIILFFIPVFLASQTIPLLSELLKWTSSWEKMWKLLFYSTIGSFIGATSTSSVFFPMIWVVKTGVLSSIFLSFAALLVSSILLKNTKLQIFSFFILIFYVFFNILPHNRTPYNLFQKANSYHNISIYDNGENRIFSLNSWYSSGIDRTTKRSFFSYVIEVEEKLKEKKAKNILVIWAAWFSFPNDISEYDFVENIDVLDVDPAVKDIAEKYFLEKKLSKKIHFYPEPSRFFINKKYSDIASIESKNLPKYDFIFIDAYSGKTPPAQMLTYEFFHTLTQIWDNIYFNIILDQSLQSTFSKNLFATINKAFEESYYKDMNENERKMTNMVITNNPHKDYLKNNIYSDKIYTDNKNSIEIDIFKMR
jgi:hypothetical protein